MTNKGKLVLIPTIIADNTEDTVIAPQLRKYLPDISHFLVENVRTARRFLSALKIYPSIEELHFEILDKDTTPDQINDFFRPIAEGHDIGVMSESGCPGIADPGSLAVAFAHSQRISVIPLVGPSSITLALMASGLNGQKFCFHGYLPIDVQANAKAIRDLEKESKSGRQTQIFIETPYRNNALMNHFLKNLAGNTRLCIALDITGPEQYIACKRIQEWKTEGVSLPKKPAIFLFLA